MLIIGGIAYLIFFIALARFCWNGNTMARLTTTH